MWQLFRDNFHFCVLVFSVLQSPAYGMISANKNLSIYKDSYITASHL